jgi:hypothetical protein
MCVQCMAGAMTAAAGATGTRAWLAAYRPRWLTPPRLHRITVALIVVAVVLSGGLFSGVHGGAQGQPAQDTRDVSVR